MANSVPKNIVICCDGTGNEFNTQRNSNVVKLYSTLLINEGQIGYYHPGVGTMGAPTARNWWEKQWTRVKGLAFGGGFFEDVGRAYQYLMQTYNEYQVDGERVHDNVYLFGFSRGAYTVRALASLLEMFGLLCPGNEAQIPYVLRMFERKHNQKSHRALLDEACAFKAVFSRNCYIHFVGVWDTVSSVGWVTEPVRLPYTARNPIVATVRHAMSIDERRIFFRQNSFVPVIEGDDMGDGTTSPITQDFKQVWFAGVHSDVGGSYSLDESGLSQIALEWMLLEAENKRLLLNREAVKNVLRVSDSQRAPNPLAMQHESLCGLWWILEYLPHKSYDQATKTYKWSIPRGRPRYMPAEPCIHETVQMRLNNKADYHPNNMTHAGSIEPWVRYPQGIGASV